MNKEIKLGLKKRKEFNKTISSYYDKIDYLKSNNGTEKEIKEIKDKVSKIEKERDSFDEEFAKTIFNIYAPKNPKLYDRYKKKVVLWEDVFGNDFNKLSKLNKVSISCLFDDDAKYNLK